MATDASAPYPAPVVPSSPERGAIEGGAFFRTGPPRRPSSPSWAASPWRQAGVSIGLGFFGVFLAQANVVFQIVLGAPVFEELLKFGLALAIVTGLGVSSRWQRFALALLPGITFGLFEHAFSYPDDTDWGLRVRVLFHAASPALSMAVYDAAARLSDVNVRWAATAPASVFHWLNNFVALLFGLASVASEELAEGPSLAFSAAVATLVWLSALAAVTHQEAVASALHGLWARFAPASLKEGAEAAEAEAAPPTGPQRSTQAAPPEEDPPP